MAKQRRKTRPQPSLMLQARAARAALESSAHPTTQRYDDMRMYAFLSIFHPEMSEDRRRQLCASA